MRILIFLLIALCVIKADSINIINSTPLEDELKESDVQRFINEGLLDKDSAKDLLINSKDDEENERPLVNFYKQIAESSEETPLLLENVYGHLGFFGKTNLLNKAVGGSYGIFSGSIGLQYDFKESVFLDIGIYGISGIVGGKLHNKVFLDSAMPISGFIANRANVKYVAKDEFQKEIFDITAGRFLSKRDWIRNYIQGVSVNANYEWFKLWLDWVDEQAIATREILTDFKIFKQKYNDRWLISAGLGASIFGIDVLPYYYFFSGNLWAAGGKINAEFDFASKKWKSVTTLHYVYANNKRDFYANGKANGKESQILWIEEVLRWRSNNKIVSFGLGYISVFGARFELANVGNMSRFESYNTQGYGIMGIGGSDNGGNSSNMFFGKTQSFYGFVGFKIDDFSMMFLGRNSQGNNDFLGEYITADRINQHQYALSARYRIIDGLYIGGVASFMLENSVNKSYAKGYIEFKI